MTTPGTVAMLDQIPALATEAIRTRGTSPVSSDGAGRRPVPGSRVLADLDRMLALSGANDRDGLGVLASWVRAIHDELAEAGEVIPLPADSVSSACSWLAARDGWIAGRGFEGEYRDDVRRLWSVLRGICKVSDHDPRCMTSGCQDRMTLQAGGYYLCPSNGITWSGHLRHHYADGAAVLSAKVLSEYARKVAEGDES